MSFQIMINLAMALLWMIINDAWSFASFISGFFLGLLVLYFMRGFFRERLYFHRVYAALVLVLIFFKELILSSFSVARQILSPKLNISPGIFEMETTLEHEWEVTLLSLLITLTPGTLVVEVAPDNRSLFIHAMDLQSVEAAKEEIRNSFEKAIREVSR
ncbi:multisubunit sodium/proton antiporter, MrpE subunit [Marinococcus luteus]|jgi:multicomponent Na+:H+ antiporter subunit E|uniref:Multisubunit sodium/proton antiporter, MrpE subunit n=1 Tax=Marinococcus luteus TaxID=1122204 RepID=A0A1H2S5Z2_9BACI|nr:Na+/H+ antiporter subunit E [Marinococcus luteus]SDW26389.1 multisubunit sodium/proton antiporter, MrpE subunit [Marinococcus luteus]